MQITQQKLDFGFLSDVKMVQSIIDGCQLSAGAFTSLSWPAMRTHSHKATQLLPHLGHFVSLSVVKSIRRFHSPGVLSSCLPFLNTHMFGSPSRRLVIEMPRRRGISRRGGSSAPRGRASLSPSQNVIPISSASPSSPPKIQPARSQTPPFSPPVSPSVVNWTGQW